MKPHLSILLTAMSGLLIAGCVTAPAPTPKTPTAKTAESPKPEAAPAAVQPVAQAVAPAAVEAASAMAAEPAAVAVSPEAQAVVERLTQGTAVMPHTLAGRTGFPAALASLQPGAKAPEVDSTAGSRIPTRGLTADGSSIDLIEKDWTGLVLVPVEKEASWLTYSGFKILAMEAHPLSDGRVRVWLRLLNKGSEPMQGQVGCVFRLRGAPEPGSPRFYPLPFPGGEIRDVFFVSPMGDLVKYTPSVRTESMAR